jgi:hypothetical protein
LPPTFPESGCEEIVPPPSESELPQPATRNVQQ